MAEYIGYQDPLLGGDKFKDVPSLWVRESDGAEQLFKKTHNGWLVYRENGHKSFTQLHPTEWGWKFVRFEDGKNKN